MNFPLSLIVKVGRLKLLAIRRRCSRISHPSAADEQTRQILADFQACEVIVGSGLIPPHIGLRSCAGSLTVKIVLIEFGLSTFK